MLRQLLLLAALIAGLNPAPAAADGRPAYFRGDNVVHARLILDSRTVAPGGATTASIELTPDPGWHLYGPEHGDAGSPPDIMWGLPSGLHAGQIAFPPARRVVLHGLTTFEYHGRTTLRVPLSVTGEANPGQHLDIVANVSWLVCSNVCVPGRTALAGTLDITPASMSGVAMIAAFFGLAFLGGLILNLMPCVFPVLSFKALRAIGETYEVRVRGAIGYAAGITTSCTLLGLSLIIARRAGAAIGWGFQLQSPVFVAFLTLLFIFLGLAMSGAFELTLPIPTSLQRRAAAAGAFGDGVLVTLIASACIAPYMGAALAFALSASAPVAVGVFIALGLGLALPQTLLMVTPALLRWLPKPGAWTLVARRVLAVPLYLSAVWLAWVFALEISPTLHTTSGPSTPNASTFSATRLRMLRADGRAVFVDVGAAWCITCKVNERVALERPEVSRRLNDLDVTVLRGDWTNQDSEITSYLRSLGAAGVPLYVYYPRHGAGRLWPQLLTPAVVIEELSRG